MANPTIEKTSSTPFDENQYLRMFSNSWQLFRYTDVLYFLDEKNEQCSISIEMFGYNSASDVLEYTDSDYSARVAEEHTFLIEFFALW